MEEQGRIVELDENVVNRIAAGEVIQRPMNVLKELMENSIDAGSTSITVTVKDGGLKYLHVQDNGCGIVKADLDMVCKRFTTSKLKTFNDLTSLTTFGFRGEALSSISHVAHLSITTKTKQSPCAFTVKYLDGKPQGNPTPCAAQQGTSIQVEQLFYCVSTRRDALLKSSSEELARIVDVVTRYAVHYPHILFSLRRQGETAGQIRTQGNVTREQVISQLYGKGVGTELVSVDCACPSLGFEARGLISSPQCVIKSKFNLLLFVNNRLVQSSALKRALQMIYSAYLVKGLHPFVYLSLEVNPANVDVNVHPTKEQVHFLHETQILEKIQSVIDESLSGANLNRKFAVQLQSEDKTSSPKPQATTPKAICDSTKDSPKIYAHQLVRTDSRVQKIDQFLGVVQSPQTQATPNKESPRPNTHFTQNSPQTRATPNEEPPRPNTQNSRVSFHESPALSANENNAGPSNEQTHQNDQLQQSLLPEEEVQQVYSADLRDLGLESVTNLRQAVADDTSPFLRSVIRGHTFVGVIDPTQAVVQYSTGLYVFDVFSMSKQLFYQVALFRFANFGHVILSEKADLKEMMKIANGSLNDEQLQDYCNLLESRSTMLADYFSITIEDGHLLSLPQMITGYTPQLEGIPKFIIKLCDIDWSQEQICLDAICQCLADLFCMHREYCEGDDHSSMGGISCKWLIEFVLLPSFKGKLMPPKIFTQQNVIRKLTDLSDLYKVFERC